MLECVVFFSGKNPPQKNEFCDGGVGGVAGVSSATDGDVIVHLVHLAVLYYCRAICARILSKVKMTFFCFCFFLFEGVVRVCP